MSSLIYFFTNLILITKFWIQLRLFLSIIVILLLVFQPFFLLFSFFFSLELLGSCPFCFYSSCDVDFHHLGTLNQDYTQISCPSFLALAVPLLTARELLPIYDVFSFFFLFFIDFQGLLEGDRRPSLCYDLSPYFCTLLAFSNRARYFPGSYLY